MSFRTLLRIAAVALAVAFTAGPSIAYAQEALSIDAPFAFKVGASAFPAGKYGLQPNDKEMSMKITPPKGAAAVVSVVTRLGTLEPLPAEAKVVFDKVGEVFYLSEIWIPGFDGYLVHVTKEKHTHVTVNANKKG